MAFLIKFIVFFLQNEFLNPNLQEWDLILFIKLLECIPNFLTTARIYPQLININLLEYTPCSVKANRKINAIKRWDKIILALTIPDIITGLIDR